LAALEGGEVFWLDTEHTFSPPRALELLRAIRGAGSLADPAADGQALDALQRIRRRVCSSLGDVHTIASDLVQRTQEGAELPALVIVDSIAAVARNDGDVLAEDQRSWVPKRQAALSALAGLFKSLVAFRVAGSSQAPSCVVVTNQVSGDPARGGNKVALGHVWHHAVNWRVVLSHLPPGDERGLGAKENSVGGGRFLHLEKSPCVGPLSLQFLIDPAGLREVASPG
jgi:RecA/RadA recombinase